MKDLFISHSWNDKKIIEPIASALQKSGLTVWYDSLEVVPGDSIPEKVDHGLRNSKLVLFCLSENFLSGKWIKEELKAAVDLVKLPNNMSMIVPLMLCPAQKIIEAYPVPFAELAHIEYHNDPEEIVIEIKKVLSKIDDLGKQFWYEQGKETYGEQNYGKSLMLFKKSLDHDFLFLPALVFYMKILSLNEDNELIAKLLEERHDKWNEMDLKGLDSNILDEMQEYVSKNILGHKMNNYEIKNSIGDFLFLEINRSKSWRYYKNLVNKRDPSILEEQMLVAMLTTGKADAADYFIDLVNQTNNDGLKKSLSTAYYIIGKKINEKRDAILKAVRVLLNDENEEVRASAIMPYYYFAQDGRDYAFRMLEAKTPEIRYTALLMLTNKYEQEIGDNWQPGSRIEGQPDIRLTPSLVRKLLRDPSEVVRDEVRSCIEKGWLPQPKFDLFSKFRRIPDEHEDEKQVEKLSDNLNDVNLKLISSIAESSPFRSVRRSAVEALTRSDMEFKDTFLERLLNNEESQLVKKEIKELIIEKGGPAFVNDILSFIEKEMETTEKDDSYFIEKAMKRIFLIGSSSEREYVLRILLENGFIKCLAEHILELPAVNLNDKVRSVFTWGFEKLQYKKSLILAAGKYRTHLPDIEKELKTSDNLRDRIAAIRALSYNDKINNPTETLRAEIRKLMASIEKGETDDDELWALLDAIDGIIEFSGRKEALDYLKSYYNKINHDWVFPLRQAWERMKILGHREPNDKFVGAGDMVPDGWVNNNEPIYGIAK